VILTLAIGIGATTVIYSVTDHVVLRALPYAEADRLVNVQLISERMSKLTNLIPVNGAHLLAWGEGCTACEAVAALRNGSLTLTGGGDPVQLSVVRVSDNLFTMLGAKAELGRLFVPGDDRPSSERQVVISDALWRRQFGASTDMVGRSITLGDSSWRVIGVVAPSFQMLHGRELGDLARLPDRTDAFVPLALTAQERTTPGGYDFSVLARLKPGVSASTARAQFDAANAAVEAQMGEDGTPSRTSVTPLQTQIVGTAGRPLVLLLAAVGAMLLLMCVNLSNLLLARGAARQRESAVRVALGAARERLVRQALTETSLLTLCGGALGIVLSFWGLRGLVALAPADLPRIGEVHLDGRVLAMSALLSIVAGLSFGLAPAWRFGHVAPGDVLKQGGRSATDSRTGVRARSTLVAAQIGMSALLLVVGGLFLKSFVRVLGVDKGFNADRVLALNVVLPRGVYFRPDDRIQFYAATIERLGALPGVTASGVTSALPVEGESWVDNLRAGEQGPGLNANFRFVSPGMFAVLGQPLRAGRTFANSDRGRRTIVLSEGAANELWPGENPIGKQVHAGSDSTYEVVGIVPDVRTSGLERPGSAVAYKPYWEMGLSAATMLIRTSGDPASLAAAARAALRDVGPTAAVSRIRTMDDVISGAVAERRFELILVGLFAVTALLTATIGIYGIISHSLSRRTNEIGIRMALGAQPADVHALVFSEMLRPVIVGLAAGLGAAVLVGRLISGLLFEVQPSDATVLLAVTLLLAIVAAAACVVPARRATRIDSADALRAG
jgi:putative ABC transport system permease protein